MSPDRVLAVAGAVALPFALGPLLLGLVGRTKAIAAGRRGPPLLQPWFEIAKLLRKGTVVSDASGAALVVGPVASWAATAAAAALVPLGGSPGALGFRGDLFLFAGLLATGRFLLSLSAWDVGSSFEAMGASRDLSFAALTEPVLLLALAASTCAAGSTSLTALLAVASIPVPTAVLAAVALYVVLLAENARVPFDDPATHLELTMVHEVVVLDHGGPDLAFVHWAAGARLFLFGSLLTAPLTGLVPAGAVGLAVHVALVAGVGVLVGVTESVTARLRLVRVPHLVLTGLLVAAFAAAIVVLRRGP